MNSLELPSLSFDDNDELLPSEPSVEDLRGPLSEDDIAFLQAWVDFAPDVGQQFCETRGAEDYGDVDVGPDTLILATRIFALTQRLALFSDDLPPGSGYRTYGNAIYSPRASRKALGCCQLCFNPLFGASFGGSAAGWHDGDSDGDDDDLLSRRLRRDHLPYEYEALMRADMRDLEAYGLINWSPDDLVDAALERDFGAAQSTPGSLPGDHAAGAAAAGAGSSSSWEAIIDDTACYTSDLSLAIAPGTPSAVRSTPTCCFRTQAAPGGTAPLTCTEVRGGPAAAPAVPSSGPASAVTPGARGAGPLDGGEAEQAAWAHFLEGLGQLSYEYEALMNADMQDLETRGFVNWSPEDLVEAALERNANLHAPPAAAVPRVAVKRDQTGADPGVPQPTTPTTRHLKEVPFGLRLQVGDSLELVSADCGVGGGRKKGAYYRNSSPGGSSGDGDDTAAASGACHPHRGGAAGSLPFGSALPSLALPSAPCLSAPTDVCGSPPAPATPDSNHESPSCFQGPAARALARMIAEAVAAEAAAAAAAAAVAATDATDAAAASAAAAKRGGPETAAGRIAGAGSNSEMDSEGADWRRFLDGLGHLPYEYEALMQADMRDLEEYGFVHWSVDELVDATLARDLG